MKKNTYDKLVAKVNNINTSRFLLKTKYGADKTKLENKIPDTSGLVKKSDYNTKITELENKIPNISNLVKKSDYNTKITKTENNVTQLQAYDLSYFKGKQYFGEVSGKQNYLVFLPLSKYFKLNSIVGVTDYVLSWQSKVLSNEIIKPPTTSNNSLDPKLNYYFTKTRVQFIGSCLKQSSHIFTHKKIVNIYVVYELAASTSHTSDPTIKNCLFGAVTLTKNAVFHFQVVDLVKMY